MSMARCGCAFTILYRFVKRAECEFNCISKEDVRGKNLILKNQPAIFHGIFNGFLRSVCIFSGSQKKTLK